MRDTEGCVEFGFSAFSDKGVVLKFMANGGFRPVARKDAGGGMERENFLADALKKERAIAAGKIPASHTLAK
jgi:hypothetical protein